MDTFTHALSGAVLARALAPDHGPIPVRTLVGVGFWAAAFPDIDFVSRLFGPLVYLEYHRSLTHSLVLLPLWALLLGWLGAKLYRDRYDRQGWWKCWKTTGSSPADRKALTLVAGAALTIHIFGDLITAYGTMALAPLNWVKLSWPVTFIIDFYFSGILLLTLVLALWLRRAGRRIAVGGLAALIAYVGWQGDLAWQAGQVAERHARELGLKQYRVHAQPQPLSPLHWKLVVETADRYLIAYLRLYGDQAPPPGADAGLFARIGALYRPGTDLHWLNHDRFATGAAGGLAGEVYALPQLARVRDFMQFPTLAGVDRRPDQECVWFEDQRFVLDGVRDDVFRFGACRGPGLGWRAYRLRSGEPVPL